MMGFFDISGDLAAWLTLAVVAGMFVLFLLERWTTEVVAIGGVALLLVLGLASALFSARRVLKIDPIDATTGAGVGR